VRCPFCSHLESKVTDSRLSAVGDVTRRRRECERCARRFTTYERVEEILPLVVKKDGRREPFDRVKLLGGLQRACQKREIPVAEIEMILDAVERDLIDSGDKEVKAAVIGEKVMPLLRARDEIAYVRFASVYRSFRDLEEFRAELEKVARDRGRPSSDPPPSSGARSADAPSVRPAPVVAPRAAGGAGASKDQPQ
jgi:transcriptional repressor NrdR